MTGITQATRLKVLLNSSHSPHGFTALDFPLMVYFPFTSLLGFQTLFHLFALKSKPEPASTAVPFINLMICYDSLLDKDSGRLGEPST